MIKKIFYNIGVILLCGVMFVACTPPQTRENRGRANRYVSDNSFDIVEFGTQDGEPLYWYIIENGENYYVLLSADIVDTMKYNDSDDKVEWFDTTLYDYLNSDFVNEHFDADDRERLMFISDVDPGVVTMPSINNLIDLYENISYAPPYYYNQKDFYANKYIVAKPLKRALYNEIEIFDNEMFANLMQEDTVDTRYDFANGCSSYWLLDNYEDTANICYVLPTGYIGDIEPSRNYIGIRPMIRIKK